MPHTGYVRYGPGWQMADFGAECLALPCVRPCAWGRWPGLTGFLLGSFCFFAVRCAMCARAAVIVARQGELWWCLAHAGRHG